MLALPRIFRAISATLLALSASVFLGEAAVGRADEPRATYALDDEPVFDPWLGEPLDDCVCQSCLANGGRSPAGLLEDASVFFGVDGSKQPQDFGINANFGGRTALNWGLPISRVWGLGVQVGTALNASANAVQVPELLGESPDRWQSFSTVGLYQRTDAGLRWGVGHDFLEQESFDRFSLGQWRFLGAWEIRSRHTLGIQVALPSYRDEGFFNTSRVTLDPIAQGSVFWRQTWESHVQTTFWGGIAEGHGEANVVTGDRPRLDEQFVFGADFFAPLNDRMALFGEANFIMPPDTGTVDAYLGVVVFPWGDAWHARQHQFAPLFSLANNTNFSVDLRR